MEYPIFVEKDATYSATFRTACQTTGGTMRILVDGIKIDSITFTSTGGWQTYADNKKDINLKAGSHTLKFLMTAAGYNLNWFQFDLTNSGTGIRDKHVTKLNAYPNPNNGVFTLSGDDNINSVAFYSCTGALIKYLKVVNNQSLNVSDLPTGFYIAKVNSNNQKANTIEILKIK
jgi:hypothetical protein